MISPMYAASFKDSAMNAAKNGVYQLCANTPQICGKTSQTISSSNSVGVARKNQL